MTDIYRKPVLSPRLPGLLYDLFTLHLFSSSSWSFQRAEAMAAVTLVWGQGEDDGIHLVNGEEEVGREDDEGADEQREAWMPCTRDGVSETRL